MSILYINEAPNNSFDERQLPNGVYRYEGYFSTVHYCIDSPTRKTEEEIFNYLGNRSIEFLIDSERYIIDLK